MEELMNDYYGTTNPNLYSEFRNNKDFGTSSWDSDIAKQYHADLALMMNERDLAADWFEQYDSYAAKFNQLMNLGVSPELAVQSLLGQGADAKRGSSPSVGGSGASSAINSLVTGVNASLDSVNQAVSTDLAMQRQSAEINHLNSESALNYANAAEVAPNAQSSRKRMDVQNQSDYQSMKESEARIEQIGIQNNLTEEQTRLASQVADNYQNLTDAEIRLKYSQIEQYCSQTALNREKVVTEQHERDLIDANKVLAEANTDVAKANRENVVADTKGKQITNDIQMQLKEFQDVVGHPLGADERDIVKGYIEKGDYNGLVDFYGATLNISLYKNSLLNKYTLPEIVSRAAKKQMRHGSTLNPFE